MVNLFARFEHPIRSFDPTDVRALDPLLLDRDGRLSIYYAPFDYVNTTAKLVLIGITPGRTQMTSALMEAKRQLDRGADPELACRMAKQAASFRGLRGNLVAMLDHFGISTWLGIDSCNRLFDEFNPMVQTTSILRYPVFVDKSNYNGSSRVRKNRLLQRHVLDYFAKEAKELSSAVFVPLGPRVSEVLEWLAAEGGVESEKVPTGFPHPSGANSERINYILGKKPESGLSSKTNARKLDNAKANIQSKVASLSSL